MKKTFRIIGAMALCAVIAPAFASCGDDDDDNGDIDVPETMDGTRLSAMNGSLISYDSKGRLVSAASPYSFQIDYSAGKIYLGSDDDDVMNIRFNGHGYVTELSASWDYEEDDERYSGSGKTTFSYDKDGHITKINSESKEKVTDLDDNSSWTENYKSRTDLTWTASNLASVVTNGEENEPGDNDTWFSQYDYSYNGEVNAFQQMPMAVSGAYSDDDEYMLMAAAGLFGKGPGFLPSSIDVKIIEDGRVNTATVPLSYTLNTNGTISWERLGGAQTYHWVYNNVGGSHAPAKAKKAEKRHVRDFFVKKH